MSLQHYQTMYIAQWQYDWHYDAMAKSPWHSDHDSMKLWLSLRRYDYVAMATAMATTTITNTTVTTLMVITMMACMNVIEGSKGKIRKGLEVEEDNAKIR